MSPVNDFEMGPEEAGADRRRMGTVWRARMRTRSNRVPARLSERKTAGTRMKGECWRKLQEWRGEPGERTLWLGTGWCAKEMP